MNKVLILDTSASDSRIMADLLVKAGYDPVCVESIMAGKTEAAKLPPGAVIVTAMNLRDGIVRELINWLKTEGYTFPVIAMVENLNPMELLEVMSGGGAMDVVQRRAIDKQLVETVGKYARPEEIVLTLDNQLIPRVSEVWRKVEEKVSAIAATNANAIVFGECGTGKEQIAWQIYQKSSREQKPITIVEAGGTIIIKNVNLLSFEKQSVLLHILETEHPDVRVICTAESKLLKMVADKSFRPQPVLHAAAVGYFSAVVERGHRGYSRDRWLLPQTIRF